VKTDGCDGGGSSAAIVVIALARAKAMSVPTSKQLGVGNQEGAAAALVAQSEHLAKKSSLRSDGMW